MKLSDENDSGARKAYARYGGLAIQMGLVIALFAYAGQWLDRKFQNLTPWFTAGFCLAGIGASFYLMLKDIFRKNS